MIPFDFTIPDLEENEVNVKRRVMTMVMADLNSRERIDPDNFNGEVG